MDAVSALNGMYGEEMLAETILDPVRIRRKHAGNFDTSNDLTSEASKEVASHALRALGEELERAGLAINSPEETDPRTAT